MGRDREDQKRQLFGPRVDLDAVAVPVYHVQPALPVQPYRNGPPEEVLDVRRALVLALPSDVHRRPQVGGSIIVLLARALSIGSDGRLGSFEWRETSRWEARLGY